MQKMLERVIYDDDDDDDDDDGGDDGDDDDDLLYGDARLRELRDDRRARCGVGFGICTPRFSWI